MAGASYKGFIRAFKAAFPLTLPVMAGFFILGLAYGVLMQSVGLGYGWTFLMSFLVFAGSMQYVALTLFAASFSPIGALAVTLTVNARHVFYGLSMLDRLNGVGKFKPYIIFALCDESFSLLCSNEAPEGVDPGLFMFMISFLCRWYWIIASVCGALLGHLVAFSTKGLDFALTAMFIVIFLNQWEKKENRASSLVGIGCSLVSLIVFGGNNFIIPAMALILGTFAFSSKKLTEGVM